MEEINLKKELRRCKKSARKGAKLAREQLKKLSESLGDAKTSIDTTLSELNSSSCYLPEATEALSNQLKVTRDSFDFVSSQLQQDIVDLESNLSKFRITLFGRTMAGKSTLMETLTQGSGESIGNGSQRTTRDVRAYIWNDLEITDVPGIAAFDGLDDENVAYEAAKQADLVLFLITDDGPQAYEADCLNHLRQMGKPIICVVNVKSSIQKEKLKLAIRDIERKFDRERLEAIKSQFVTYGKNADQNWDDIRFIYVHLLSAFMSLNESDSEISTKLHELSRIDDLKSCIIDQVKTRGQYYRVKNFIDIVSVPVLETIEELFRQSIANRDLNGIIFGKLNNLESWKNAFIRDATNQSDALITKIKSQLQSEVATFAEDHFNDKKTEKAWNELIAQKHLESQCEDFLNGLAKQCSDKIQELSREIIVELSYYQNIINNSPVSIQRMHSIVNPKRAWDWGMMAVEGGLTIAEVVLWCVSGTASAAFLPIGIILGGIGIIHIIGKILFSKFGNNADKARKKLEEALNNNTDEICESLKSQIDLSIGNLIQETIDRQLEELNRIILTVSQLSSTQKDLGQNLIPRYQEESCDIVSEALKLMWNFLTPGKINTAARIPGNSILISLENKKSISDAILDKLEKLMQETVICLDFREDKKLLVDDLFYSIPEIKRFFENKNSGNYIAEISSPTTKTIDIIRLAEQLCGDIIEYKVV